MADKAANTVAKTILNMHPLQRLPSQSRTFSASLHLTGLISFTLAFKHLHDNPSPINDAYGWHLQFLTIIGLALATVTFSVAFLADVTLNPQLFLVKNALSITGTPLEVLISLLYWGIQSVSKIDPSLVIPDWLEPLSLIDDLNFHFVPALLLAVDFLFFSPPWTISALPALGISGVLAIVYWFWIAKCYEMNGYYPYPLFNVPTQERIMVFVGAALVMTASTFCLKGLYVLVNGRRVLETGDRNVKAKSGNLKRA